MLTKFRRQPFFKYYDCIALLYLRIFAPSEKMYTRYFIRLSYNGSNYHGWQYQPNAMSVQEMLQDKVSVLLREKTDIMGAGRTDTGVHATEYYAHFDALRDDLHTDADFLFKLNCMLPDDIAIHGVYAMPENAHARFAAVARTYHYHLVRKKDAFAVGRAWEVRWRNLDAEKMNEAAAILLNYKNFASFERTGSDNKTSICDVTESYWEINGDKMKYVITANRFLRNMVRAVVGTLVDVGRGKLQPADLHTIIETQQRSEAGSSAPAHGLYLARIKYPEHYNLD